MLNYEAMGWRSVQGLPCFSPDGSWDRLHPKKMAQGCKEKNYKLITELMKVAFQNNASETDK